MQRPTPPLPFLALNSVDTRNPGFICSAPVPDDSLSLLDSTSALRSPSTASSADTPRDIHSEGGLGNPVKVSVDQKKLPTLSRTMSLHPATPAEDATLSQDPRPHRAESTMNRGGTLEPLTDPTDDTEEQEFPAAAVPAPAVTTPTPAPHTGHIRNTTTSDASSHAPLRRTKSESGARASAASAEQPRSAVPEVCTDATANDCLWRKLEPGSHRDSVSSSSSISSSDTVVDLSLPNLAGKSLSAAGASFESQWVRSPRRASASDHTLRVNKSKSNPNLRQRERPADDLRPRSLQPPDDSDVSPPSGLTQRRHTWSRLYMEGLKQSFASRPSAAATTPLSASLSKSLGDLTSDDISCNFDSKYRSISRSVVARPTRDRLHNSSPQKARPTSDLTERLRRLTDVEPLTARDFAPENRAQESWDDEMLVRRTSSRSQSRVRYIANRAKKAQERQRLQGLIPGTGPGLTGINGSPIEERGNPEGACCVAQSPCTNVDLLSHVSPRQSRLSADPENTEVVFMFKL